MNLPDWTEPVARYMLEEGLANTLKLSAIALVGSALIGITLGTLLTIRFLPLRARDPRSTSRSGEACRSS